MRIVLDYRPALRQRTGVGEYVHELTRALAATAGDEVVAFSSSWKDRLDPALLPGVEPVDARVPVRVLNALWHRLEWPPIERFTGPIDVAHSAHPLLLPARSAVQAITIHDLDFLDHPERTSREIRRDYPALARAHAERADLVVVSSAHTAALVSRRFAVPEERLVLCPAGAPGWRPRPPRERGEYFLFVGTLEPRKNIGTLLDAYEALAGRMAAAPPLRLAGKAGPCAGEWLARASRPPLAGRVTHLGYIDPGERERLYARAAAVVVPSLYEGFGLTALEAMTAGVPVIASNRGSLPEVVGDAALLIDPEDPAALSAAMEAVVTDHALAATMADAGRTRSQAFSWRRSAATLREAYARALALRRGAR